MTIDEIVFLREQLRRQCVAFLTELEKAADNYDPAADIPTGDLGAALIAVALQAQISEFGKAIAHRIEQRAGTKT